MPRRPSTDEELLAIAKTGNTELLDLLDKSETQRLIKLASRAQSDEGAARTARSPRPLPIPTPTDKVEPEKREPFFTGDRPVAIEPFGLDSMKKSSNLSQVGQVLANVPIDVANIGAGLLRTAGRGIGAVTAGAEFFTRGLDPRSSEPERVAREKMEERGGAFVQDVQGIIGAILKVPPAMAGFIVSNIAPQLEPYLQKMGIGREEFHRMSVENPVGTALIVKGFLSGGKASVSPKSRAAPALTTAETRARAKPRAESSPAEIARRDKQSLDTAKLYAEAAAQEFTGAASEPFPKARGKAALFERELGAERGVPAFETLRKATNRINEGVRRIQQQHKPPLSRRVQAKAGGKPLDIPKLSQAEQTAMSNTLRGIVRRNPDGTYEYGAISRAGVERLPKKLEAREVALEARKPGTLLEDGRVVGPILEDGTGIQLYRPIWPEEAAVRHQALLQDSPKAAEFMDRILATEEAPIVTSAGDRLPALSRSVLKEQYGIEGLTANEGLAASALVRKAFGDKATGTVIPNEFSWVPENPLPAQGIGARLRNALRPTRASSRRSKTGATAEAIQEGGLHHDFNRALGRTRIELFREGIHNEMASRMLVLSAEKISKGETPESLSASGFVPFSKTGLWPDSFRVRRFMAKNKEWFEESGIEVPEAMDATFMTGGKGWKIPSLVADELGAFFAEKPRSINPRARQMMESTDKLAGNVVGAINLFRLTRVATANRNAISNQFISSTKIMRDFYRGALQQIPGARWQERPFQDFFSDIRAIGTSFGPRVRSQLPPEALGSTMLMEIEAAGPAARVGGKMLRATGFNYWDIYTKRVVYEGVIDANARQAWHQAKRLNMTEGQTRAEFLSEYRKDGVPPEIEALAYREMDIWGGYDYSNVPRPLAAFKRSPVGRATIPYPTFFYKLWNTNMELLGPKTIADIMNPKTPTPKRINAIANVMAGVTMYSLLWELIGPDGDLPDGIKETDLPFEVQKFGRVPANVPDDLKSKVGLETDEDLWLRMYDIPFVGEVMAAKAIWKGDYQLGDFLNDRIALGPLVNGITISVGLSNRFNKRLTRASRLGQEVASWLPFTSEMQTIRRTIDPFKRETSDERKSAMVNFVSAMADNYPVLSELLPERISQRKLSAIKQPKFSALASWGLLNTLPISEKDREVAISLARVAQLSDEKSALDHDRLRNDVINIMDPMGETQAGKVKGLARTDPQEIEVRFQRLRIAIETSKAFDVGGIEAARAKALEIIESIDDVRVRGLVTRSVRSRLRDLTIRGKHGLLGVELRKVPRRIRKQVAEEAGVQLKETAAPQ